MVDYQGLRNNSFALIEIGNGKIHIKGYKRTSSSEKLYKLQKTVVKNVYDVHDTHSVLTTHIPIVRL